MGTLRGDGDAEEVDTRVVVEEEAPALCASDSTRVRYDDVDALVGLSS